MAFSLIRPDAHFMAQPQDFRISLLGASEPAWNEEVWFAHFGEDGVGHAVLTTREMFIYNQSSFWNLQPWAQDEYFDTL